ncbi:MAG TPA: TetR/AcrR family transcriptional regulator [Chloroflexota bacterium]
MVRSATGRQRGDRTRAAILNAARKEFARGGYAGARIDAIARRAGVRKTLIFYYFGNKEGLSQAVMAERLATYALPRDELSASPEDLFQWPLWLFGRGDETRDAVHFLLSEGIGAELARTRLTQEEQRRDSFQQQVARVRDEQRSGGLPVELDAAQLTFFLYILGVYPYILPQGAYLITGAAPDEPVFRSRFEAFLGDLGRVLRAGRTPDPVQPGRVDQSKLADAAAAASKSLPANGQRPAPVGEGSRDLTRAQIVAAAFKEFGLHGFRGARLEAIARRARVPRGLIAYYFGTKDGLFDAVVVERAQSTERMQHQLHMDPHDPFAWSLSLFALGEPAIDWVRMLVWEGLDWEAPEIASATGSELLHETSRRGFWRQRIATVKMHQAEGRLAERLDPEQLTFFLWVLGLYPNLVPQIAYLITGGWPSDEQFRTSFERFIRALARHMQPTRQVPDLPRGSGYRPD